MMQVLTRPQFSEETAASAVEIIDERDLARGRLVELDALGQVRRPQGWQGLKGKIAAFLSDDVHMATSPELVQDVADAHAFISMTVVPAFEQVGAALEGAGREVQVTDCGSVALLRVRHQGRTEFTVAARTRLTSSGVVPVFETSGRNGGLPRRGIACLHLDGMTKVMAALTHEVGREQVTAYALARHRDLAAQ